MVRLLSICLIILFICSCATNVVLFENGKRQPNHVVNLQTVDQKLHLTYFIESQKKVVVGDEYMYWPSTFEPHENTWLNDEDEKITFTLRIINQNTDEIQVNYNKILFYEGKQSWEKKVLYEGKLPYKEFIIPIKREKGETKVWFDLYKKEELYCFTREVKFRY